MSKAATTYGSFPLHGTSSTRLFLFFHWAKVGSWLTFRSILRRYLRWREITAFYRYCARRDRCSSIWLLTSGPLKMIRALHYDDRLHWREGGRGGGGGVAKSKCKSRHVYGNHHVYELSQRRPCVCVATSDPQPPRPLLLYHRFTTTAALNKCRMFPFHNNLDFKYLKTNKKKQPSERPAH